VDVPVRFKISATSVMNAFYVPELAGMIYAMPGMETSLNAVQNKPIKSMGFSANYSGAGYSDMRFSYRGVAQGDFDGWVKSVKDGGGNLNRASYLTLEKPSIKDPVRHYASVDNDMFYRVLNRCVADGVVCMDKMMMDDARKSHEMAMARMPQTAATRLAQANGEVCTTPNETVKKK
jgi:cytochrome o ubiquinol oxidase subunit 2